MPDCRKSASPFTFWEDNPSAFASLSNFLTAPSTCPTVGVQPNNTATSIQQINILTSDTSILVSQITHAIPSTPPDSPIPGAIYYLPASSEIPYWLYVDEEEWAEEYDEDQWGDRESSNDNDTESDDRDDGGDNADGELEDGDEDHHYSDNNDDDEDGYEGYAEDDDEYGGGGRGGYYY